MTYSETSPLHKIPCLKNFTQNVVKCWRIAEEFAQRIGRLRSDTKRRAVSLRFFRFRTLLSSEALSVCVCVCVCCILWNSHFHVLRSSRDVYFTAPSPKHRHIHAKVSFRLASSSATGSFLQLKLTATYQSLNSAALAYSQTEPVMLFQASLPTTPEAIKCHKPPTIDLTATMQNPCARSTGLYGRKNQITQAYYISFIYLVPVNSLVVSWSSHYSQLQMQLQGSVRPKCVQPMQSFHTQNRDAGTQH